MMLMRAVPFYPTFGDRGLGLPGLTGLKSAELAEDDGVLAFHERAD